MADKGQSKVGNGKGQKAVNGTNGANGNGTVKPKPKLMKANPAFGYATNDLEESIKDASEAWETNSLVEDILDELPEVADPDDPEIISASAAVELRRTFRELGPEVFMERYIDREAYPARKLLAAFGLRVRDQYEDQPPEFYHPFLMYAMCRELCRRAKLLKHNSVEDAVNLIQNAKNIIVLTGAGISTSLGIPDFRSAGTGLYAQLANRPELDIVDPQEVFDIKRFRENPRIFYEVAKNILPDQDKFSPTHAFIKLLQDKGKLLTNYSQNIDNLEAVAGIRKDKLIQCHGSFARATCQNQSCRHNVPISAIEDDIRAGKVPRCPKCAPKERTTANSRKRKVGGGAGRPKKKSGSRWTDDDLDGDYGGDGGSGTNDDNDELPANKGFMKPDITFFREDLPADFSERLIKHDRDRVDLVIVIGTSLKVKPVSEIPSYLSRHVPQIYISRTPITHVNFDIDLLGYCDVVVTELARRLGWKFEHPMVNPDQEIIVEQDRENRSLHRFENAPLPGAESQYEQYDSPQQLTPDVQDPPYALASEVRDNY